VDGVESEEVQIQIVVLPLYYQTMWFKFILTALGIFSLLFIYKLRTRQMKLRQLVLERKVEKATTEIREQKNEVEKQKEEIEEAHKEITDSINYAERIQRSFLATKEILDKNLKDYFVFFKPKEAVSGDFYWAAELYNGNFAWSVADSTGHGVPGAIMSLLNISSLEKSIETETSPEKILFKTREIIINRLKKDGSPDGGKDGMDCNLLVINKERDTLTFASAHNPVIIIRNSEIIEIKGDKIPVGKHDRDQEAFTLNTLQLQKGDVIYALTDGFPDQFGGEKGKKYMIKNLKNKFLEIALLPMNEQKVILSKEFENWKSNNEQIDDVCIIGVRI
jgi:serine phosphatase RsbU (regulator of sigma subunit)